MIGNRGVLATFLAITFIIVILMGFSDKLDGSKSRKELCHIGKVDSCARTGGIDR